MKMGDAKSLSSLEAEYTDFTERKAWQIEFHKIGRISLQNQYAVVEARKPENRHLNRYRDVNPYDHSRVVLNQKPFDYINANIVKVEKANRKYILTQGPLPFTVDHFWLMVWEQDSRAILMLNKVVEKSEIKCHCYWPQHVGQTLTLSQVNLEIKQVHYEDYKFYYTRVFSVRHMMTEESREIIQFHYTTWPDFGVPASPVAFLAFLRRVRDAGVLGETWGPAVVHCSAGIGRSGTFCLVDSCLVLIEQYGVENVNIREILLEMRKDRMGLIQTPAQLRFSYQAIIEGVKRMDPNYVVREEEDALACLPPADADEGFPPTPPPLIPPPPPPLEGVGEETPPLPPVRGASLQAVSPSRPLPAIPASASLGNLAYTADHSSSDSEPLLQESSSEEDHIMDHSNVVSPSISEIRRRRDKDLSEKISEMKYKSRQSEGRSYFKRSWVTPIVITLGILACTTLIYTYMKH